MPGHIFTNTRFLSAKYNRTKNKICVSKIFLVLSRILVFFRAALFSWLCYTPHSHAIRALCTFHDRVQNTHAFDVGILLLLVCAFHLHRWRPYRVECTGSLLTSEVKRRRARLVLGWGTAWEDLRVLPAFANHRAHMHCIMCPTTMRTRLHTLHPAAVTARHSAPLSHHCK